MARSIGGAGWCRATLLAPAFLAVALAADGQPAEPAAAAPLLKEHRYRMSAAIRPLLFWVGDKDVGGARIVWRGDGEGRTGYEFLLGSDPDRTPRRINRWGWVREDAGPTGATQVGLMRKTDEESIEQARAQVGFEGEYIFKVIHTEVSGGMARAENKVFRVARDFTYYDLSELLDVVGQRSQAPASVNSAALPEGTHPGFLLAVAELVDRGVAAAAGTPQELMHGVVTRFNFNAIVYVLTLRATTWEDHKEYGGRRYDRLARLDFESYNPKLRTTERFTLVCGTEGELKGVPVYVKYQPKWWFRAEGVLDESQSFERPGRRRTDAGD